MRPKFPLGNVYATPGAVEALRVGMVSAGLFLGRHVQGDWGDLDEEDKAANECALKDGTRLLSAYTIPSTGTRLWIITEWDRSASTLLLPEEY